MRQVRNRFTRCHHDPAAALPLIVRLSSGPRAAALRRRAMAQAQRRPQPRTRILEICPWPDNAGRRDRCSPCPVLRGEHNKADFASLVALASRNWIAYWRALSSKPIAASLVPSLRTCVVRQGCDIVTKIKDAPERQTATAEPRCPNCTAPPRLRHTLLDPRRGRTVRLFECSTCGEWIWDD